MTRLDLAENALRPTALRALTANRYLPAGRVIVSDLTLAALTPEVALPTTAPAALRRSAVTMYPLIADPPLDAGGVQRATALMIPPAAPDEADPITGAPDALAGVTGADRAE